MWNEDLKYLLLNWALQTCKSIGKSTQNYKIWQVFQLVLKLRQIKALKNIVLLKHNVKTKC